MSEQDLVSPKMNPVFNELRLENQFIDAVINVQDVEFPVHKVVLCSCAPYFRSLLTRWSVPDQRVFKTSIVSPDMMRLILDYTYTSCLFVTENNVKELTLAADRISAMEILQICCDFLVKTMSPKNCIGMWKFTATVPHTKLSTAAFQFILDHFEDVVFCEEFLQLSMEDLGNIISEDGLLVHQESFVYESVMRWIAYEPERERYIVDLFSKVRLALLGWEYINRDVLSNNLVNSSKGCLSIVSSANTLKQRMLAIQPLLPSLNNLLARPRLPFAILLAIGGWSSNDPTNAFEAYDIRTQHWISVENNQRPRAYHGTAFVDGFIYCIGGFDRMEHFNSVHRFNPVTYTWQEMAPMYFRRCYVSVAVLNGCIYALGGYDGHSRLKTAECYQPGRNQWNLIASMHDQRSDASCTAFEGKVYICGGFNGQDCLESAECYNPQTNQWTMIASMNSRRSGVGVTAYAGCIYAVGGYDGNERLRTAEAYNLRYNTWTDVAPMLTRRSNFGIEVIENRLFVVGGFNGRSTTFHVECYNAATDQWTPARDMDIFRSALSCCVIHGLPNMAEYAFPRDALPFVESEEEEWDSL